MRGKQLARSKRHRLKTDQNCEERSEDQAFAAPEEARPQIVVGVGHARHAVEPDRTVPVTKHHSHLRVRIDRYAGLSVDRVTLEAAVANARLWVVQQKAALLDGEPRNAAAGHDVRLNSPARQEEQL